MGHGPVSWFEYPQWSSSLQTKEVVLVLASRKLTVKAGMGLAATSHYFLNVDVVTEMLVAPAASPQSVPGDEHSVLDGDGDVEQDVGTEAVGGRSR